MGYWDASISIKDKKKNLSVKKKIERDLSSPVLMSVVNLPQCKSMCVIRCKCSELCLNSKSRPVQSVGYSCTEIPNNHGIC